MYKRGVLFVVSGPSGSGKTTLVSRLLRLKSVQRVFVRSVSYTTRPKRPEEADGEDYFFISEKEFQRARRSKKILEATQYLGYYYATPRAFVEEQLAQGRHILLCLDVRGALEIKRVFSRMAVTIFILPPSLRSLRERISGRNCKTTVREVRLRLARAEHELAAARHYDYRVVNKDLPKTVQRLKAIIFSEIAAHSA